VALVMVISNEKDNYMAQVLPPNRELQVASALMSHIVGRVTIKCYEVDGIRSDPTRSAMELAIQENKNESNPI